MIGVDLTPLIIKGIKCTFAISVLFVVEAMIIYLALVIDNRLALLEKKNKFFKILSIPLMLVAILPLSVPLIALALNRVSILNNTFYTLHSSKVVTLIFAICAFAVANIVFDIPSWQKDFSNYTLRLNAKFYKYITQFSIAAFTVGISIWQHIPWNINKDENDKNFFSLYLAITLGGFLLYTVVMLLTLLILRPYKKGGLFYHLYKNNNISRSYMKGHHHHHHHRRR